jgi:hypothetical protein
MTTLFRRLQPAKKFRVTIGAISQLLKIPKHLIVRVECWAYIIFFHRIDRGGQFISYRRLQHWLNAVACQIQNSSTCQQLRQLWLAIEQDWHKYKKQYSDKSYPFLSQIWMKCWNKLSTPSPPQSETLPAVPEALLCYPDAALVLLNLDL